MRLRAAASVVGVGAVAAAVLAGAPATVDAAVPEPAVPKAEVDYRTVVETLKQEIPAMMAQTGVAGATVALVDGNRVVMARGFGWADRARRRPVTARTLFHIGSLSKTLTAIAVMQLVEQGKVDLDAPLRRYVPELRLLPRFMRNRITVRSVLDHHSGIPGDMFYGMITLRRPDPGFNAWLLRALRRMPPERRVNTGFAYSNSGYVLLRRLVEHVTGEPFADHTDRTLFRRMGMRSSTFDDSLAPDHALTRNYAPVVDRQGQPTGRTRAGPREYVNGWTAGSVLSSASDMSKYLRTLVNKGRGVAGRIVQPRTLRRMTRPQTRLPGDFTVVLGLSWFLADGWMGRTFGHDGATTRNFSMLTVHPGQRLGVFVSTNTAGGSALASAVADRAMALTYTAKTGRQQPPPAVLPDPGPRTPTRRELARAEGVYAGFTDYTRVEADGDQLVMTTVGGAAPTEQRLTALADGWWAEVGDPGVQIGFQTVPAAGSRRAARRLLVARFGGDTTIQTMPLGQRIPQGRVPGRWRRATGTYRARLDASRATDLVSRVIRLRVHDGFPELHLASVPALGRQVLHPVNGNRAFTFGWSGNGGRRKGDLVRLDGDRLTYMGVTYRKLS